MRRLSAIVVGVCGAVMLALSPLGASAFEQTVVPAGKAAKITGALPEDPVPGLELTVPSQSGNSTQTGAGVVLPGFGALGALPKLDFGLELLYGTPDNKVVGDVPTELPPDALTVYGSVKKTF